MPELNEVGDDEGDDCIAIRALDGTVGEAATVEQLPIARVRLCSLYARRVTAAGSALQKSP